MKTSLNFGCMKIAHESILIKPTFCTAITAATWTRIADFNQHVSGC